MKYFVTRYSSLLFLAVLLLVTSITGYNYFTNYQVVTQNLGQTQIVLTPQQEKENQAQQKRGNVVGGLFVGLLIASIQYVVSIKEKNKLDKIKALSVINVLYNRDDKDYYKKLINSSKNEIKIMGITAYRLFKDFADADSTSSGDKVLINALLRNVKVKILLPSKEFLNDSNKANFDSTKAKMEKIKQLYGKSFDYKYFNHEAAHSIFSIDNQTIIGPVIPNISSKDTPAIHISNSSKYAETYLEYFNKEWENAN